nr:PREDICTED: probable ADP-ribosylation factor GTPase-activating protein AGD14 isoform X2 [Musa acuminata subsp. malaccensis]
MANLVKEEKKNEKIIRGLLKLPANRRCINCNSLGPQYVCTNFWTFVCTNCSGIHREFTHRIKSISMAKFSSQEVAALQEGGNERARELYFKDWDPQHHSFPHSSNIDRLRDFIKNVYVYRRYTGESVGDRPQKMKDKRDNYNENQKAESYKSGLRSPPYEDRYSPSGRNSDRIFRYNYGERSPGYDQGKYKRSPAYFEVVDDRRRDNKVGNVRQNRRLEAPRFLEAPNPEGKSPDHQKNVNKSSDPVVNQAKDTSVDDIPPLKIGETAISMVTDDSTQMVPDDSTQMESNLSSSSICSADANSVQLKGSYFESLMDLIVDPNLPVATTEEQAVPQQTTSDTDDGGNSSASDISASGGENLPTIHQEQLSLLKSTGSPSNQPSNVPAVGTSNDQTSMSSVAPHEQGSFTAASINPSGHLPQITTKSSQETNAGISSQPTSAGSTHGGRKELPADFFTSLYPTTPLSAPGWQRGPYPGIGYNMQFPTRVTAATYTQTSKSVNPFDLTSDPAPTFPSVTPQQVPLPNMTSPLALIRTSSFGAPSPRWNPSEHLPYATSVSPGTFMMHQVPNNMPRELAMMSVGNQGGLGTDNRGTDCGTSGIHQQPAISYAQASTPNSVNPVGGNPFG